ncbi:MAG: GNAT family N-acetyltransferase [Actinomycetota bacterium]|nr:GNAT family N-acetyltransferase [Actinomycetota bacterium]
MSDGGAGDGVVTRLRAARPDERELLERWRREPASEFDDLADPADVPVHVEERDAGGGELVVTDGADRPLGTVSWRQVAYGPNAASTAVNIGIALRPRAWARGHGSRAQRMLAEYLFAQLPVHRVEASTDVDHVAEQRALERAGFVREGVLRGAQWRRGTWHDLVSYARLRSDG